MTSLKAYFWPADVYRRLIHVLGLLVWLGDYAVGVYFFILELPEILREGIGFFLNDLFLRLVIGLAFGASALLPNFLGSIGAATTRASLPMFLVCMDAFVLPTLVQVGFLFAGRMREPGHSSVRADEVIDIGPFADYLSLAFVQLLGVSEAPFPVMEGLSHFTPHTILLTDQIEVGQW